MDIISYPPSPRFKPTLSYSYTKMSAQELLEIYTENNQIYVFGPTETVCRLMQDGLAGLHWGQPERLRDGFSRITTAVGYDLGVKRGSVHHIAASIAKKEPQWRVISASFTGQKHLDLSFMLSNI